MRPLSSWMPKGRACHLSSRWDWAAPVSNTPGHGRGPRQKPPAGLGGFFLLLPLELRGQIGCDIVTMRKVFLLAFLLMPLLAAAQTAEPVVQAILFYSPTCPHCHQVINELLVPMQTEYGERLQILGVDTTNPAGQQLYKNAIEHFAIPQNRLGVPTLIVGETILVGSGEIPDQFPNIVEAGLAGGGIGWPDIPDLTLIVPDLPPSADPAAANAVEEEAIALAAGDGAESVAVNLQQASDTIETGTEAAAPSSLATAPDPAFALAWIVLIGMVAALLYAAWRLLASRPPQTANPGPAIGPVDNWLVPLLALTGLAVALYLAYVETTGVTAVCGPVGECNVVQSSPYARLAGIPVAVLGVLSYLAIIALWAAQRRLYGRRALLARQALLLLTLFGVLFSIYLTLLELFAIGAICAWCLSSALLTTLILLLVVRAFGGKQPRSTMRLSASEKRCHERSLRSRPFAQAGPIAGHRHHPAQDL
jgi:uncharacterized membrane protein